MTKENKNTFPKFAFSGSWAMKQDALKKLASSSFEGFKENGAVDQKNIIDDIGNGIFVIHIDGPLSYRGDFWSALFGMDNYDSITSAFKDCLDNVKCQGIILDISSPGGEVAGCADLGNLIYGSRGKKKCGIVARTGGMMASAAYWLGSCAEKVYTSEQGELGCIGVLASYPTVENAETLIVSDLSPNKAPDPKTPEGEAQLKSVLNELASVFINTVARNRGTTYDDVLLHYGKGGTFVGESAVKAGLADGVITMDELVQKMINNTEGQMADEKKPAGSPAAEPKADENAVKQQIIAEERTRVSAIQNAFKGLAMDDDCASFIANGKSAGEAVAFALEKCKEKLSAGTPADGKLSDAQKLAIQKGLAASAEPQNSVQGGMPGAMDSKKQHAEWAKQFAENRYGRK